MRRFKTRMPTMGSLDYNARNLLITPSRAAYLDFSAVGWDWTGAASCALSIRAWGARSVRVVCVRLDAGGVVGERRRFF